MQDLFKAFTENEVKPIAEAVDEEERFPLENVKTRGNWHDGYSYFKSVWGCRGR